MHLAALHLHPVKSLRGFSVASTEIDALGPIGDRRFLVVDRQGTFLTQRTLPQMARIDALIDGQHLTLRCAHLEDLRVRQSSDPFAALVTVRIWKSEGLQAEDCGRPAEDWLTSALGLPSRLVRIGPAFLRPVKKAAARDGDVVTFADSVPFLVATEESLASLNRWIVESGGEPVPMGRFRPNLILSGSTPFAEDRWNRLRVGEVIFRSAGACVRCIVPTTDQLTGVRGDEPLRTLARFRRDPLEPTHVLFGLNLVNESKTGTLRLGDEAEVLE